MRQVETLNLHLNWKSILQAAYQCPQRFKNQVYFLIESPFNFLYPSSNKRSKVALQVSI